MTKPLNERLQDMAKLGFWIRTKQEPYRAVRWEPQRHEDGRQKFRGQNWVEVLRHGATRPAERFYGADVEPAGPHEWLSYYPAVHEPVCGWGRPRLPDGVMQYCPRTREVTDGAIQPFCAKHQLELQGEEEHAGESHSHAE